MTGNYNMISSLFSSNSSSNFMSGIDFTLYSSIRTGTYKKLLNAYYEKTDNTSSSSSDNDNKVQTNSQVKANAMSVRDSASALIDSVDELNDRKLWEKKTVTDKDGNKSEEYDKKAIYSAVSSFVDDYNALIDSAGKSSDNSVLRSTANAVNFTKANKSLLEKAGISIGRDNKLSIDETKFENANMTDVKSAFYGTGSYGKSIASSSSMVYGSAVTQLAKNDLYSSSGTYNYISGATFSKFI